MEAMDKIPTNISEQKYEPEVSPKIDLCAIYKGSDGTNKTWKLVNGDAENVVDIHAHLNFEFRIAYAVAYLKSPEAQEIQFFINSDDGVEMWLNQNKIHSNNVMRAFAHDPDCAKVKVKKGLNTILIKISQGGQDWCFKVSINSKLPMKSAANPNALK